MTIALKNAMPATQTNPLKDYIFTSESVSEGHPDKICDQISDAILDAFLPADPQRRPTLHPTNPTNFGGLVREGSGPADITRDVMEGIARQTIQKIGYEQADYHWQHIEIG